MRLLLQLPLRRRLGAQDSHDHFLTLLVEHVLELLDPGVVQLALLLPRPCHLVDDDAHSLDLLG